MAPKWARLSAEISHTCAGGQGTPTFWGLACQIGPAHSSPLHCISHRWSAGFWEDGLVAALSRPLTAQDKGCSQNGGWCLFAFATVRHAWGGGNQPSSFHKWLPSSRSWAECHAFWLTPAQAQHMGWLTLLLPLWRRTLIQLAPACHLSSPSVLPHFNLTSDS